MEFKEKIKQLRKQKGLSQKELADGSGIKQASYSNIESGIAERDSIKIGVALKIANTLNVPLNELFDFDLPNNNEVLKILEEENQQLKQENLKLKNQLLQENKILIDSLKSHNILYDFAYTLYHSTEQFNEDRAKAYKESKDILNASDHWRKLMPFDKENPESIIEYISKNFIWKAKE